MNNLSHKYCPQCGHTNDLEARFCMECGSSLEGAFQPEGQRRLAGGTAPPPYTQREGTDWASILAAGLALLTMRRASRKARGTAIVILFFVLFFGCPLACSLIGLVTQWFGSLFQ
ncbi:MAG: zinc-ribbon domain-containing protein [Anaerolineae bacterium]|jgi:hypothetical protein